MLKYTLARIGLFLVVAAVLLLLPFELNLFLKLGIAVLISAVLALFLLRGMRDELAAQLASAADRRAAEKARLRDALAGDDEERAPAAADEKPTEQPAADETAVDKTAVDESLAATKDPGATGDAATGDAAIREDGTAEAPDEATTTRAGDDKPATKGSEAP
jgi:hypothetical protein